MPGELTEHEIGEYVQRLAGMAERTHKTYYREVEEHGHTNAATSLISAVRYLEKAGDELSEARSRIKREETARRMRE